jgi:hypothetical protein
LFLLTRHAAFLPQHRLVVAAAIRLLTVRYGYGHRVDAYLAVHRAEVAWRWVGAGLAAAQLLAVLPDLSEGRQAVRAWLPALSAPILLYNREQDFQVILAEHNMIGPKYSSDTAGVWRLLSITECLRDI